MFHKQVVTPLRPFLLPSSSLSTNEGGFTLIEMMIVIAMIGILAAIATTGYQISVRQTQLTSTYQEVSHFKLPYQILMSEREAPANFSPLGLDMPAQTKYCQFSVTAPNINATTPDAVVCHIQNLNYLSNQSLSLDRSADGAWQCTPSAGITKAYLPQTCQ
ncbi:MAG: pilin [Psychrobacter sp.]